MRVVGVNFESPLLVTFLFHAQVIHLLSPAIAIFENVKAVTEKTRDKKGALHEACVEAIHFLHCLVAGRAFQVLYCNLRMFIKSLICLTCSSRQKLTPACTRS